MMNDLIIKELEKYENCFVNSISETDKAYYIILTDKYGNVTDKILSIINKPTYTRCKDEATLDVELNSVECELPLEYLSYRCIVKKILTEKYKAGNKQINEKLIDVVMKVIFDGYHEYSLEELYSVSSYLLSLVVKYCNEEEKNNELLLMQNEVIRRDFLNLIDEDRVYRSSDYYPYYKPASMERLCEMSDKMLDLAIWRCDGLDIDTDLLNDTHQEILKLIVESKDAIARENNAIIDKEKLLREVDCLEEQSLIDYDFCRDESKPLSERAQDFVEKVSRIFLGTTEQ